MNNLFPFIPQGLLVIVPFSAALLGQSFLWIQIFYVAQDLLNNYLFVVNYFVTQVLLLLKCTPASI